MTDSTIQSFDLKRNYDRVRDEISVAIQRVLDSQSFILGAEVQSFESDIQRYLEVDTAIGCASGSDALLLALMALGIGKGDEVITTPFSFFATVSCITRLGAIPVFADVDEGDYNLRPEQIEEKITPKTKAILPVHLFGQMCRLEEAMPRLRERGIAVVEDCAQSFAAHRVVDGVLHRSGAWGDIGCFSFFPTKNLGGYGDGGMLTTNDAQIAHRLKSLRVHGSSQTYFHEEVGLNSRLDALQAAILAVRLRHIEEWTEERRAIAARYALLFGEKGLLDRVRVPLDARGNRHTYHQYAACFEKRDELKKYLDSKNIVTRVYYPLCLHQQPCFSYLGGKEGDCPVAEKLTGEILALPMYPELSEEEQMCVVGAIADFYAAN